MIKYVPNILTSLRIISIPFIIYFFYCNQIIIALIIAILTSITDCFDGYIARKYNVQSEFGAKLDAISDKFFASGLLITLSIRYHYLLISLTFEIIIAFINLVFHLKNNVTKTLFIGKVKTCFLFFDIILGFITCFINIFKIPMYIFFIFTIILQLLCIIKYINYGIMFKK